MDLYKLFLNLNSFDDYAAFSCRFKQYYIILWVGNDGYKLSNPDASRLNLNDYSHFAVKITSAEIDLGSAQAMNEIFGFDLMDFPTGANHHFTNVGYLVPKEVLIAILQKIGVISSMPEDAGDGEDYE